MIESAGKVFEEKRYKKLSTRRNAQEVESWWISRCRKPWPPRKTSIEPESRIGEQDPTAPPSTRWH